MMTSSVGKAQVYYSILGFQLASVTVRLRIFTDGQFSLHSVGFYVLLNVGGNKQNIM